MAPRKRPRLTPSASTKTSPEIETSTSSPVPRSSRARSNRLAVPATSPEESSPQHSSVSPAPSSPWTPDAWTAAQESALFKALIRYKPTGMHKHFHMLSISSYLQTHGLSYPTASRDKVKTADGTRSTHTSIPGTWEKLSSLYDLPALDERSDAYAFGLDADTPIEAFCLPGEPITHGPAASQANGVSTKPHEQHAEDEDAAFFAKLIWARRFPKTELEADMEVSSPEPEILPFRRGPDGNVETVTLVKGSVVTPAATRGRKGDARPVIATKMSAPAPTPVSASASASAMRRRSNRRDASARASRTPVTETAGEEREAEEEAVEGEEEEEEEVGVEEEEEEEGEADEEEEEDEIDDDEDELGDRSHRSTAPVARSTRSSARVKRR